MSLVRAFKDYFEKILYRSNPSAYAKKKGVNIGNNNRFTDIPAFGTEPWLITIGNNCVFSSKVTFLTHDGSVNMLRRLDPKYKSIIKFGKIVLGDDVFVGQGVTIMPNIHIGDKAVIGTGSLVTKDVPAGAVVAGVPAKVISSSEELAKKLYKTSPKYDNSKGIRVYSVEIAEHYWNLKNGDAK